MVEPSLRMHRGVASDSVILVAESDLGLEKAVEASATAIAQAYWT